MKCKIPQKQLVEALKVIKTSKALGKFDNDEEICIKISFNKEDNKVEFMASNIGVWVCSSVKYSDFSKEKNSDELFGVEESGEVFIEAREFISLIETFHKDNILIMEIDESGDVNRFTASSSDPSKKGKKKTVSFLSIFKPKFFETSPPDEKRKRVMVSGSAILEAVKSVEFASETDVSRMHLWGIQVEIFGEDDIATCSTDTYRICWFDKTGTSRKEDPTMVTPIKSSFLSALKCIDSKRGVNIDIGEKYTILSQEGQWHGIPNAIQIGKDSMPEWRSIADSLKHRCRKYVDIPRLPLQDCLKTATLTSGGRYGLRICFNSEKSNVFMSADNIEDDYSISSYMSETEPLDAKCFSEDIECSVTFRAEHLKEIIGKFKSDSVRFYLQDTDQTVIVVDENEDFQYISSVVRSL